MSWVRGYDRDWIRHDLLAGAALVGMLIPAGMAYAQAASLPPAAGLYATIVPLLVYAALGPSRILILGPDSALAPMIAAAVLPLAGAGSPRAIALAGLLAVFIGVYLLLAALFRLGALTGLLSGPIRLGYLGGIALTVAANQLPTLLGISAPGDIPWERLAVVVGVVADRGVNVVAFLLGLGSLVLIAAPRVLRWKVPGALFAVVGSMLAVWLAALTDRVAVVGRLPQGLPLPQLAGITLPDALGLLAPAAGIALMVFADTSVLSQSLASREGLSVSGTREMAALGAANFATGLFGGFPVSVSSSRTPVAIDAGGRTQLTGVVAALLVAVFMAAVPGLTVYLPTATLAAVVIGAAFALVDPRAITRLWRMSRGESLLMFATFAGVTTIGVLQGIVIAVALSLLDFIRQAWNPYRAELGDRPDVPGYHDLSRHPEAQRVPGLILARFDAPLFFANGPVFAAFIRGLVEAEKRAVTHVVVAAEPLTGIDTTALDEVVLLDDWLDAHGIELVFAELKGPVKDKLLQFGTVERFGPDHFYPTVSAAVRDLRREDDGGSRR
ncbi:SulP family inorganic anion transporter [Sinomonas sp. JGH33]|uniref:SulP family inorganic anion transporter n=1 Tax=Sinomonas terricola TaxID=3110330 RepID=A0ABU5T702_9MICC|nr:SulP family inorganic anion transporter [Sinomonas sp. JGH33]MEA5455454.1 SulP family inorganic anion transporter [Sinomonas sp. JGH33]